MTDQVRWFDRVNDRFPGIAKAALEIAYDNGLINRTCSEADYLTRLERWLADSQPTHAVLQSAAYAQLVAIDLWLRDLPETAMQVVCAGEETEQHSILASAPTGTSDLLDAIFEHVC